MPKKNLMWDNKNLQEDFKWGNIELPGMSDEKLLNTNWNKSRDQKKLQSNEIWQKNYKKGIEQRNTSNIGKNNYKRYQDSKYLEEHKERMKIRNESENFKSKVALNGLKRRKPIRDPFGNIFDSKKSLCEYYAIEWKLAVTSVASRMTKMLKDPLSGFNYVE